VDSLPQVPDGYKRCSKCGEVKPATADFFQVREKGVLRNNCLECQKAYYARYYGEKREALLAQKRADYYARHEYHLEKAACGREKYAEQNVHWREEHRQQLRDYTRQWEKEHPEKRKQWRENNPLKRREVKARYRSRKKQAWGEYNTADIERLYEKQGGECLYCGNPLEQSFHVDHFIPLSKAGWNAPDNLALACHSCNTSKNDTLPYQWYAWNGRFPVEWEGRLL
jgi:5-methylcytosine-specific restriction endonuclease McrA